MKMKKMKILIILLSIIILLLGLSTISYGTYDYVPQKYIDIYNNSYNSHVYSGAEQNELRELVNKFKSDNLGASAVGQSLMIGNKVMRSTTELYCIEHYVRLDTVRMYKVTNFIEIDCEKYGPTVDEREKADIILSEILSRKEYGLNYGTNYKEYSDTQKALYIYLSEWLNAGNRSYYGLPTNILSSSNNANLPELDGGTEIVNKIKNEVNADITEGNLSKYRTKVKIYFLEHQGQEQQQHLMIAIPERPTETELEIYKRDSETDEPLPWVQFTIQNTDTGEYIRAVTNEDAVNHVYRVKSYSTDPAYAGGFMVNKNGYLKIVGLKPGNYEIKEIVNPNKGYDNEKNIGKKESTKVQDKIINQITFYNIKDETEEPPEEGPGDKPGSGPEDGNVTISGTVWEDEYKGKQNDSNSKKDADEKGIAGVKVYWRQANGTLIANTITDSDGYYEMKTDLEIKNHTYKVVNKSEINNSYIEFEYNGLKYTTVETTNKTTKNESVAKEITSSRRKLDNSFYDVTSDEIKTGGYKLNYDTTSTKNKATLLQSITDFPVKATTNGVVSGLMNQANTKTEEEDYCIKGCCHGDCGDPCECKYAPDCECDFEKRPYTWDIRYMNLGLVQREQPDLAITSDINKVRVIMKGQEYTYYYNGRGIRNPEDYLFDYKVKFSGKYDSTYKRPVNPSDISCINYPGNPNDMEVYVEYYIRVKNQATTLKASVGEIVNYYDNKYEIVSNGWSSSSKYGTTYKDGNYTAAYSIALDGEVIEPETTSSIIPIEFRVKDEFVKDLIKEDQLLHNVSEINIYRTFYGTETGCEQHQVAKNITGRVGSLYAGIDKDSQVGNATPGKIESYEDDTDQAPVFALVQDPNYKIISGTVYEDLATEEKLNNEERIGNGKKDSNEKGVANVKVELLKINENGDTEVAYLYSSDGKRATRVRAETYTDENGHYSFGYNGDQGEAKPIYLDENGAEENYTITGVTVDSYIIRYTYGDRTRELEANSITPDASDSIDNSVLNEKTTIGGNPINARNYKSTVILSSPLREVMKDSGYAIDADEWHLHLTDEEDSIAVDNIEKRQAIEDLQYSNFDTPINMTAYTKPFNVQIEYDTKSQESTLRQDKTTVQIKNEDNKTEVVDIINIEGLDFVTSKEGLVTSGNLTEGKDYENNWDKFDFGIIERPREDIVIDKTIENIKITLANGQVLSEGSPYTEKLNYVKALGTKDVKTRAEAINANEKLLYIEMDSELIQGARLDILYAITVTNNSEIDYEYKYDDYEYSYYYDDLFINEHITKDIKAYYYYYGEETTPIIKPSVELVVDYMDPELTCIVGEETEYNKNWKRVQAEELRNDGYISEETLKTVNREAENYLIFTTEAFKNVARGESHKENLFASKLLANQATEYTYENHVEILKLNGKIARNIDSTESTGKQVTKTYKPGTYIPNLERIKASYDEATDERNKDQILPDDKISRLLTDGTIEQAGLHNQDDDMITIRITPPTGLENSMIIYITVGVIGLIVIAGGIYFIKKKVIG